MHAQFEYGTARIKDLQVLSGKEPGSKPAASEVLLDGRRLRSSSRFWTSLHVRFGFTSNIFRYFSPAEVFDRISERVPNDRIRYCIEQKEKGPGTLLAVTSPETALMRQADLHELLERYEARDMKYCNGIVSSRHVPRFGGPFQVAGDGFENQFILDTPIDGFGRPSVYLSLLRLVCSNGMVGYAPAFRSELSVGRGEQGVAFALLRVLEGFNNEEGYAALRQRFEAATRSWASVNEVNRMYKVLARLHTNGGLTRGSSMAAQGSDGARTLEDTSLVKVFHRTTGDLSQIYGMANLDALSVKRQRTLPSACRVYDLLNFASELATHHATPLGNRMVQAFIGDLVSSEYDLENTVDQYADWRDFFIGSEDTASTLADMQRRSRN